MMLRPAERLVAFTILHQGYSSQLENPFVPLIIHVSCNLFSFSFFGGINILQASFNFIE